MTEYKGAEFELPYYEAVVAWLKGGNIGPHPVALYQHVHIGDVRPDWRSPSGSEPLFGCHYIYRWKPAPKRMVKINGRELVAPELEAPLLGQVYHIGRPGAEQHEIWQDIHWDKVLLSSGLVFLSSKDAQAMSEWLTKCRLGQT